MDANPDFNAVAYSAHTWVNVSSTGNPNSSSIDDFFNGNIMARTGHWEEGPDGHATVSILAAETHAEFDNMMQTKSRDGTTPQQLLNGGQ